MAKRIKHSDHRMHINRLNSVYRIAILKPIRKPLTKMVYLETKHQDNLLQHKSAMMDLLHSQLVVQTRKLLKVQMESKELPHLVTHPQVISELVEMWAHHLHLVRDPAHSAVKHSATVDHLINHHLAPAVHKQTHSVVRIITDQMPVPMQRATHTTRDQINLFSINRCKSITK